MFSGPWAHGGSCPLFFHNHDGVSVAKTYEHIYDIYNWKENINIGGSCIMGLFLCFNVFLYILIYFRRT